MPSISKILHAFSNQPPSQIKKREYKFYDVPPLGTGGYAVVKLALWKELPERYADLAPEGKVAVKVVSKASIEDKEKYLRILIAGWGHALETRHPHICPLLDWFESTNHYYLTFPLLTGGELLQKILDKRRFTEEETRKALVVILDTLIYIHSKGVIHRDIKAENFLYRKEDSAIDDFQLIDFGISKILTDDDSESDPKTQNEVSGTPGYAAPEVFLRTGYGKNADVFSVGVVGYAMLCGSSPWDAREPWDLVQETVRMREVNFQNRRFDKVSEQAKDFIRLLMTPSPELRPSSAQARQDPWLACPCPPPSQPPTRPSSPNPEDAPGPASHPPDPYHPIEILARQDTLRPGDESVLYRQITAHGTLPAPVSPV